MLEVISFALMQGASSSPLPIIKDPPAEMLRSGYDQCLGREVIGLLAEQITPEQVFDKAQAQCGLWLDAYVTKLASENVVPNVNFEREKVRFLAKARDLNINYVRAKRGVLASAYAAPDEPANRSAAPILPGKQPEVSSDANLPADLNAAASGPFAIAPHVLIVAGREWRPMTGLKLRGHIVGTRLHDPECDVGDVCDQIFFRNGKFLSSGPDKGPLRQKYEWLRGSYWIEDSHYCVDMQGTSRRCYALMERPDGLAFRVALGEEKGNPRLISFHSDVDSYKHF